MKMDPHASQGMFPIARVGYECEPLVMATPLLPAQKHYYYIIIVEGWAMVELAFLP